MIQKILTFKGFEEVFFKECEYEVPANYTSLTIDYSTVSPGTELFCIRENFETQPGYIAVGHTSDGKKYFVFPSLKESSAAHCNVHAFSPESLLIPLIDGIKPEEAGFLRFINIGMHPLNNTVPRPVKVAVLGLGPIGNIAAQSAKLTGAEVIGIDLLPNRRSIAEQCGIRTQEAITGNAAEYDMVIDTVCNCATLKLASEILKENGTCAMIGIVKDKPLPDSSIFRKVWDKNLHFQSGWEMKNPMSATRNNLIRAANLLAMKAYQVEPLISGIIPANIENIKSAYRNLIEKPNEHLCYVINWSPSP
ncbi:MAG: zinc-binding dehydrogenase [Victivallales bacterium]|jgi:threonine dehydrogenase-like Zn-dependent dehydrogenase|nr:zinc-binding dehydrogenase [Victivallales bacterium]